MGFFADYAAWEPSTASTERLEALLASYADATLAELEPPVGGSSWREIEDRLRAAVGGSLAIEWLAFFEYHAAWRACSQGDGTAMRQAAANLEALQVQAPDLEFEKVRRLLLLADLQRALGEFGRAFELLELADRSLAAERDRHDALRSGVLGLRGELLRESGRLDEAATAMASAVAHAFDSRDGSAIERALLRDHAFALATGRFADSRDAIVRRLDELPEQHPSRAVLLLFLGHAESGLAGTEPRLLAQATRTLTRARQLGGGHLRVRADLKRFELALRGGDLAGAAAAAADCEASLGPAADQSPPTRDAVELIGMQTRLALLQTSDPGPLSERLPRQAAAEQQLAKEWRTQAASTGGIGFLHQSTRRDLLAAGVELRLALAVGRGETDGPERALQVLIDMQLHTSLARHRGAPACTVADVQASLDPAHCVLVYLPARTHTWVFLVDRVGVHCERLPDDLSVDFALEEYATALARGPDLHDHARSFAIGELVRAGARARERLLPPPLAQRLLRARALTVVGADLVAGAVFEALPLDDGRLLGEALAIDNVASLPLAVSSIRAHRPVPRAEARLLLLGCTVPAFKFPVQVVAEAMAGYQATEAVLDEDLTLASWRRMVSAKAAILHVVAHGVTGGPTAGGPGLRLADGPLWREDVDAAMPDLVIVSACGGGAGPVRPGEGESFGSMVGAFLWSGATVVIASRRGLLALDHLQLMAQCHLQLANGVGPAEAMRVARSTAARTGDLLARAHHAQVQVFGPGRLPPVGK